LDTELREVFTSQLETLEARVYTHSESIRHMGFHDAVAQCRTDMNSELTAILGWFNIANDKVIEDFTFSRLIGTAVELVQRVSSASMLAPRTNIRGDHVVWDGRAFVPFVDILFILLENIVKHAGGDNTRADISVTIQYNRLQLIVENDLGTAVDPSSVRQRIAHLESQVSDAIQRGLIRTEGGSGYFKLHKLCRFDLKRSDYSVKFTVEDSGRFRAVIDMDIQGIAR
jgi:hypothetical protein